MRHHALFPILSFFLYVDGELSFGFEGINGIMKSIEHNLFNLVAIRLNQRKVGCTVQCGVNPLLCYRSLDQFQRFFNQRFHVKGGQDQFSWSGIFHDLIHNAIKSFGFFKNGLQVFVLGISWRKVLQ